MEVMRIALALLVLALPPFLVCWFSPQPIYLEVQTCPPADPEGWATWTWEECQDSVCVGLGAPIQVSPPTLYLIPGSSATISISKTAEVDVEVYAPTGLTTELAGNAVEVTAPLETPAGTYWLIFNVDGTEYAYPIVVYAGSLTFTGPAELKFYPARQEYIWEIHIPRGGESQVMLESTFPFPVTVTLPEMEINEFPGFSREVGESTTITIPAGGSMAATAYAGQAAGGFCCAYVTVRAEGWCNSATLTTPLAFVVEEETQQVGGVTTLEVIGLDFAGDYLAIRVKNQGPSDILNGPVSTLWSVVIRSESDETPVSILSVTEEKTDGNFEVGETLKFMVERPAGLEPEDTFTVVIYGPEGTRAEYIYVPPIPTTAPPPTTQPPETSPPTTEAPTTTPPPTTATPMPTTPSPTASGGAGAPAWAYLAVGVAIGLGVALAALLLKRPR